MANREKPDREKNRFSARAARYARVGANVSGVAARYAGRRMLGGAGSRPAGDRGRSEALGRFQGPVDEGRAIDGDHPVLLPPEYAGPELQKLQSEAPPMGWAFVKRRMMAELGAGWEKKFATFEHQPAAAASLGQVHRARSLDGAALACNCNIPTCSRPSKPTCRSSNGCWRSTSRFNSAIDTTEIGKEIGARVREELDYRREAKHVALYREMLADIDIVRVPRAWPQLSTGRLLTLDWLDGTKMLAHKNDPLAVRNRLATAMFTAWWFPFSRFGVIHGDPHLGNYSVFEHGGGPAGINLLDYGCIRIFAPKFVGGVVDLYHGLLHGKDDLIVNAYETWGFRKLSRDVIDTLNIWARFIYGPLLDDRVRTVADGVAPGEYGRREAFRVHQALKKKGPVKVPREFVFMDRAAIGLGAVFLHLGAELEFFRLFNEAIEKFSMDRVAKRQAAALERAGLD